MMAVRNPTERAEPFWNGKPEHQGLFLQHRQKHQAPVNSRQTSATLRLTVLSSGVCSSWRVWNHSSISRTNSLWVDGSPSGSSSAGDRHKEPVPIVSWWRAGAGGPAAAGSICLSGATGGFSIEQIMLPRKAFDFDPRDQDIGRNDHEPFGRFADPLPFGLAVHSDGADADPFQFSSIGPEQRQHVGAGDFDEITAGNVSKPARAALREPKDAAATCRVGA